MRKNKKFKLFLPDLKIWLLLIGGFVLIYAPAWFTPYLFSDDYCFFAQVWPGGQVLIIDLGMPLEKHEDRKHGNGSETMNLK